MDVIGYHASHEQFPPSALLEWVALAEQAGVDADHDALRVRPGRPVALGVQLFGAPHGSGIALDHRASGDAQPLRPRHLRDRRPAVTLDVSDLLRPVAGDDPHDPVGHREPDRDRVDEVGRADGRQRGQVTVGDETSPVLGQIRKRGHPFIRSHRGAPGARRQVRDRLGFAVVGIVDLMRS